MIYPVVDVEIVLTTGELKHMRNDNNSLLTWLKCWTSTQSQCDVDTYMSTDFLLNEYIRLREGRTEQPVRWRALLNAALRHRCSSDAFAADIIASGV